MGYDHLCTFISGINMPVMSKNTYKESEDDIGPVLEKVAKESCEKALEEERQLTLKNPLYVEV